MFHRIRVERRDARLVWRRGKSCKGPPSGRPKMAYRESYERTSREGGRKRNQPGLLVVSSRGFWDLDLAREDQDSLNGH